MSFFQFYMLHAFGFQGHINATSFIHLPLSEMCVTNKESDWIHWQQCAVLVTISHGEVTDWTPPASLSSHSELRWQYSSHRNPSCPQYQLNSMELGCQVLY